MSKQAFLEPILQKLNSSEERETFLVDLAVIGLDFLGSFYPQADFEQKIQLVETLSQKITKKKQINPWIQEIHDLKTQLNSLNHKIEHKFQPQQQVQQQISSNRKKNTKNESHQLQATLCQEKSFEEEGITGKITQIPGPNDRQINNYVLREERSKEKRRQHMEYNNHYQSKNVHRKIPTHLKQIQSVIKTQVQQDKQLYKQKKLKISHLKTNQSYMDYVSSGRQRSIDLQDQINEQYKHYLMKQRQMFDSQVSQEKEISVEQIPQNDCNDNDDFSDFEPNDELRNFFQEQYKINTNH